MDSLRTKSHLNAKNTRLPKEKFMLPICLTFRLHHTSSSRFGRDITLHNGSTKRVQLSPSLKPLHRINLGYLVSSNPVTSCGITAVWLFSGLSYSQRKWDIRSDLRAGKEMRVLDEIGNTSHPQSRENAVCILTSPPSLLITWYSF